MSLLYSHSALIIFGQVGKVRKRELLFFPLPLFLLIVAVCLGNIRLEAEKAVSICYESSYSSVIVLICKFLAAISCASISLIYSASLLISYCA
jgi:hypothetical protein